VSEPGFARVNVKTVFSSNRQNRWFCKDGSTFCFARSIEGKGSFHFSTSVNATIFVFYDFKKRKKKTNKYFPPRVARNFLNLFPQLSSVFNYKTNFCLHRKRHFRCFNSKQIFHFPTICFIRHFKKNFHFPPTN